MNNGGSARTRWIAVPEQPEPGRIGLPLEEKVYSSRQAAEKAFWYIQPNCLDADGNPLDDLTMKSIEVYKVQEVENVVESK